MIMKEKQSSYEKHLSDNRKAGEKWRSKPENQKKKADYDRERYLKKQIINQTGKPKTE